MLEKREEIYECVTPSGKREAKVIFRDCKFKRCVYSVINHTYNLKDWKFLGILAKEIQDLQKWYDAEGKK